MNDQVTFSLRGRNPDVLTCIANLSNDEVFTPPKFANRMLDTLAEAWAAKNGGADIWADSTVRFLDPCTKSGVFLREIASRLVKGLAAEIPNLQKRVDHILTKQVFGIGTTYLTSLLARRSIYCSKHANGEHSIAKGFRSDAGNIWFERMEHTWVDGKCTYCGANARDYERGEELETHAYAFIHTDDIETRLTEFFGDDMQFDVVIGNPPYQLGSSGGDSKGSFAMPIYHKFVQTAKSLDPQFVVMVTPSRWFAGGRGLDEYRSEMLADTHLRELVDFPDATDAFPGMDISGGVSYFLWDRSHDGPCNVQTSSAGVSSGVVARHLNAYNVFVRYNTGASILEKVWPNGVDLSKSLAVKVSPTQPFGLRTSCRGVPTSKGLRKAVLLRSSEGESWIARADIPRNAEWIDEWKVILGLAYGERGPFPYWITSSPEILEPGTACTETYLVIDRFGNEATAELFARYLRTRFVRFLISLQKYTQHLYSDRFSFVPDLPANQSWTDNKLYKKFGITKDEIEFIHNMIRPMGEGDE
ncbi:MAG: Eco57I restriction-modification methylase domain-containing protein [Candidatus Sulfotelmatobacter sp.]